MIKDIYFWAFDDIPGLGKFLGNVHHKQIKKSDGALHHYSNNLVQAVFDNFSCNISSVSGQKQTHSLTPIIVQSGKRSMSGNDSKTIPCLKKNLLKSADSKEVQKKKYKGARKPMMPDMETAKTVAERYTIFHEITHTP